ncbi:DUF1622 domain-containing protein [Lysobacter soli]|jgi:uncharacterized membrane protein|uniref:DUF1622 domain-containing protein n=1 Tax=Lysobacter soli TaxID=453783 RepID=UPI0012EDC1CD|nr:DUF1622 domain-containing protein [Lysobacter soli]QGW65272.1 DUF1622 domain-containing protein [Lysobacter soli]
MERWLIAVSEPTILAIDFIALGTIVLGTLIAVKDGIALLMAQGEIDRHERRHLWMRYSHWLVAGLTFQLAADIIESSITPDWDGIGRLAAVAVIRTFLNYFLERDVSEIRELERARERESLPEKPAP